MIQTNILFQKGSGPMLFFFLLLLQDSSYDRLFFCGESEVLWRNWTSGSRNGCLWWREHRAWHKGWWDAFNYQWNWYFPLFLKIKEIMIERFQWCLWSPVHTRQWWTQPRCHPRDGSTIATPCVSSLPAVQPCQAILHCRAVSEAEERVKHHSCIREASHQCVALGQVPPPNR